MPYYYTDQSREADPHALPDVEVFEADQEPREVEKASWFQGDGFYYAHGSPGCLWDSDPVGPYESEEQALAAAREAAGFCAHGNRFELCRDVLCTIVTENLG